MKDKCVRWLKKPLICSFILNLVVGLILFLIYDFHWETNDDVYMSSIAYGTYGQYDEHLVFINIIIGRLLKGFLTLCPWIPWYGVLQTVIVFVSFVIIGYRIFDIRLDFEMLTISTVMIWIMGLQFYVQMQFTKTAGIASIAGILLILRFCAQRKGKNWISFIMGLVMCSVGMMYRASTFYPSFAILFVLGVYELIYYNNRNLVKRLLRYGGCALLLLVILKGLVVYNSSMYTKDIKYTEYMQFNSARAKLMDYYWPDYYANIASYNELGISEEDIEFYKSWNLADKDIINTENLIKINSFKDIDELDEQKSVRDFAVNFIKTYMGYSFVVVIIFISIIGINKKKYWIFFALSSAVFILLQFYLYYKGRVFIQRVDAVFALAIITLLSIVLAYEEPAEAKRVFCTAMMLSPLLLVLLHTQENTDYLSELSADEQQQWIEYLQDNKETLFMMENWTNVRLWDSIYSIWNVAPKGLGENVYLLGGWQYQSPNTNEILEIYGINNPFVEMVDNDSVKFVITGDTSGFEKYIERHYYSDVEFKPVNRIGDSAIYQVQQSGN